MANLIKTVYALNKKKGWDHVFDWHGPVFLFTNENIKEYATQIPAIRGGKVLAVGAGGDHAFEALLNGAKQVDTFDINCLQELVIELKQKMIKYLPREQFMQFFLDKNYFFDPAIIWPIWKTLSPSLRLFLERFYKTEDMSMFIYHKSYSTCYSLDGCSYLADPQAYAELKRIMPDKIKFIHSDLGGLKRKLTQKYDAMLLSNIYAYMNQDIEDASTRLSRFYSDTLAPIAEDFLTQDGGQICLNYMWSVAQPEKVHDLMKNFTKYRAESIDDFTDNKHSFHAIDVSPARCDIMGFCPDMAVVMTQKTR